MRKAGLTATDATAGGVPHPRGFRKCQLVRSAGYQPDEDDWWPCVSRRFAGFMQQLKKEGYDHLDLDKLIAFRIHGVSPDFIERVQTLGYQHLSRTNWWPCAFTRLADSFRI